MNKSIAIIIMFLMMPRLAYGNQYSIKDFQNVNDKEAYYSEEHYNTQHTFRREVIGENEVKTVTIYPGKHITIVFPDVVKNVSAGNSTKLHKVFKPNEKWVKFKAAKWLGETDIHIHTKKRIYVFMFKIAVDPGRHTGFFEVVEPSRLSEIKQSQAKKMTVGQIYRAVNFYKKMCETSQINPLEFRKNTLNKRFYNSVFDLNVNAVYTCSNPMLYVVDLVLKNNSQKTFTVKPQEVCLYLDNTKLIPNIVQMGSTIEKSEILGGHRTKKILLIVKGIPVDTRLSRITGIDLNINNYKYKFTE